VKRQGLVLSVFLRRRIEKKWQFRLKIAPMYVHVATKTLFFKKSRQFICKILQKIAENNDQNNA
jgi:hypothetical protein